MSELINVVLTAPVANLLVVVGLIFLAIAVVGNISGKIEPGKAGRIASGIIGGVLLVTGLTMHLGSIPLKKRDISSVPTTGRICTICSERVLTEGDLQGKSARELTLMRNKIYAIHGREFKSADLRDHFARQPWYKPNPGYHEGLLTL